MIVCMCNGVSEARIRKLAADGVADFETLQEQTGCSTCCGCCEDMARDIFADARQPAGATLAQPLALPVAQFA